MASPSLHDTALLHGPPVLQFLWVHLRLPSCSPTPATSAADGGHSPCRAVALLFPPAWMPFPRHPHHPLLHLSFILAQMPCSVSESHPDDDMEMQTTGPSTTPPSPDPVTCSPFAPPASPWACDVISLFLKAHCLLCLPPPHTLERKHKGGRNVFPLLHQCFLTAERRPRHSAHTQEIFAE